jgi:hypothetical protein
MMSGICASQRLDGSSMTVSFPPRAVTCSVDTRGAANIHFQPEPKLVDGTMILPPVPKA